MVRFFQNLRRIWPPSAELAVPQQETGNRGRGFPCCNFLDAPIQIQVVPVRVNRQYGLGGMGV